MIVSIKRATRARDSSIASERTTQLCGSRRFNKYSRAESWWIRNKKNENGGLGEEHKRGSGSVTSIVCLLPAGPADCSIAHLAHIVHTGPGLHPLHLSWGICKGVHSNWLSLRGGLGNVSHCSPLLDRLIRLVAAPSMIPIVSSKGEEPCLWMGDPCSHPRRRTDDSYG